MKRLLWWGLGIAVTGAMAAGACAYWFWTDMHRALDRPIVLHEHTELFKVTRGASVAELAATLFERGWLERPLYWRLEARRLKLERSLQAGLYEVVDGTTPRQLLRQFVDGAVKQFQVRFIEGSNFLEMRAVLSRQAHLKQTLAGLTDQEVLMHIPAAASHPEGLFFPSTYHYQQGDADLQILQRAYRRMQEILAREWDARAPGLPYRAPNEALIMASIVEKESGLGSERAQIAGVFVRRLQRGMKLQTDPTVIYGLGVRFDGNLRRVDLRTDTPYNTYTRLGLPPTPIAMPSAASIHAALHPADGDALFFVARGDGSHQFSPTLSEHNAAVRKYQLRGGSRGE